MNFCISENLLSNSSLISVTSRFSSPMFSLIDFFPRIFSIVLVTILTEYRSGLICTSLLNLSSFLTADLYFYETPTDRVVKGLFFLVSSYSSDSSFIEIDSSFIDRTV